MALGCDMTSAPLVSYSETLQRASVFNPNSEEQDEEEEEDSGLSDEEEEFSDFSESSMPARRKRGAGGGRRGKVKGGHRLKAGRINLRIPGFGLQKLGASQLVRFIPLSKLKVAAKKVLKASGVKRLRGKKGRVGRKRGKKSSKKRRRRRRKAAAATV